MRKLVLLGLVRLGGVVTPLGISQDGRFDAADLPVVVVPPAPRARPLTGEPPTCQGGCAQVMPERPEISDEEVQRLLEDLGKDRPEVPSKALTALIFYGKSVSKHLNDHGHGGLSSEWITILQRELARKFVRVEFRMQDEAGRVNVRLSKVYPLGEKRRHLADEAIGVQPPRLSLILQRVDVDRIWSRI